MNKPRAKHEQLTGPGVFLSFDKPLKEFYSVNMLSTDTNYIYRSVAKIN